MQVLLPQFQQGRTLIAFVSGLVAGLLIAAVAAIAITQAPVPFLNKVKRPGDLVQSSNDGKLPDPNKSLYSAPPAPIDNSKGAQAVLQAEQMPIPKFEARPGTAPTEPEASHYLLQAGAYKTSGDADSMRARLALLGLDARVSPVEQGGVTLYRVRIGPYGQVDEVNKTRKLLADNKIEAQVLRVR